VLSLGAEPVCLIQHQHLEPFLPFHIDGPALGHVLHVGPFKLCSMKGIHKADTLTVLYMLQAAMLLQNRKSCFAGRAGCEALLWCLHAESHARIHKVTPLLRFEHPQDEDSRCSWRREMGRATHRD